jgi:predicted metal-dependent hydrolase
VRATSTPSRRCSEPAPAALLQGIDEFNRRLFFEQHETLEDAWIEESDAVRYLYQGILQIGVAFYHLRRGNYRGATALLERGMGYLRPFAPACMSVDVARLLEETEHARSALLRLGPTGLGAFEESLIPRIYLVGCASGSSNNG